MNVRPTSSDKTPTPQVAKKALSPQEGAAALKNAFAKLDEAFGRMVIVTHLSLILGS